MKAKLRKAFATILTVSMLMSMLSVSAFATDSVVDNNDGTTTTTETTTSEDSSGKVTVVVKVDTETGTDNVLSTETTETVTETVTVTDPETGEAESVEQVVSETVTKTEYQEENFQGDKNLTDMPEVSAGLVAGETTTGEASSAETKVEVVEGENGDELEIETTITERDLTVETDSVTKTEGDNHGELDSIVDAEGNAVDTETNVVDENVVAGTLNKVQNIAQNGYMSSANNLDALKEQVKDATTGATEADLAALADLTEEKALEITQAALAAAANGTVIDSYTGAEKMLYEYLMSKASEQPSEKPAEQIMDIGNMNLVIGDKIGEKETTVTNAEGETTTKTDIYEGSLNFSLTVVPTENDDLLVCLQYVDADGATQTVTKRLAGENGEGQTYETITAAEDGSYTIGGLKLSENEDLKFDLKLEGLQNLEDNLYIYSDGENSKQVATGRHEVNTTTSVSFSFEMKKDTKQVEKKTVPLNVAIEVHDVIPTSKTATPLDENDQTDVTLTVPGTAEDVSSDIVFIIGHGPSSNYGYILEMIHRMLVATDGTEAKIKIGMVGFADTTAKETVLPLTEMKDTVPGNAVADYRLANKATSESDEDYNARKAEYEANIANQLAVNPDLAQDMEFVIARALERAESVYNGVNLESSLITARDMLAADEEVPAERKHMIVISTGLAYWFDNDDGKPSFIVRSSSAENGQPQHGDYYRWLEHRHPGTSTTLYGYKIPAAYINDTDTYIEAWEDYWTDICTWIAQDQDDYVYSVRDTFAAFTGRLKSRIIVNEEDLALVQKDANGKYMLLPYVANANPKTNTKAQHALAYERGQYEALMVYRQMETPIGQSVTTLLKDANGEFKTLPGMGFNCYAIANGKGSNPGEEDQWMESDQIGYNFMHMMGGKNTVNYRDGDTSFFDSIENKVLYSCGIGTYVEDYMGYDPVDGNFDFITDASTIQLKVAGTNYTTEMTSSTVDENNNNKIIQASYKFTKPGASEATFWLDYYYGNGIDEEYFVWTFGEDVSLANQPALTYKLQLKDKNTTIGTHSVATNLHAVLYPKNSEGKYGDPQAFPVPELTYTVGKTYQVTVEYRDKANESNIADTYVSAETLAGSAYDVTDKDKIEISGYTYDSTTGDALTGTLDGNKVIIVYYTKDTTPPPPGGGETPPSGGGNPPSGGSTPPSGGGFIEIPEDDIPLVEIPDEDIPLVDIPEDDIPLADIPKTGDASALWMALSALSGAGLFLTRKKREDD